jgi:hypothetical protein
VAKTYIYESEFSANLDVVKNNNIFSFILIQKKLMNVTNGLQIKTAVLSPAVDRFIIKIKIKHCNKLSSRIMIMQIITLNM